MYRNRAGIGLGGLGVTVGTSGFMVWAVLAVAAWGLTGQAARAVAAETAGSAERVGADPAQLDQIVGKALDYLAKHQTDDGWFSKPAGVGVTALVTTAILRNGRTPSDPVVAKSLRLLEGFVQPDGGVYTPQSDMRNYETCIAVMCFTEANADKRYDKIIHGAEKYLKQTQWSEEQGKDRSDMFYGGAGYGRHKRPDLSNTAFLVDALAACGKGSNDEAIRKALVFVSRCQNFESEHNTTPNAAKNPDGGFYYTCVGGGESSAGKTAEGGLRSYASMTYSGLRSMIYAGLGPNDPRVKAASQWIRQHYDLKSNPGLGGEGLYYYYDTFAKTLSTMKEPLFEDAQGVKHDWRRELMAELAAQQQPSGAWTNPKSRWLEGDPNLVTGYALLALSYCRTGKE
ncbi:MAG: prenyltransferase/squalene oxidase repeat-containing protein [Thermoguttaceae bacterium]|jgi:squalene-hopene/tetraprenyl-beta-curcumene cyclase